MDSIDSALRTLTGMQNIDVEFIKSMQFNDQGFIINEVMITVNGKHYRFAIEWNWAYMHRGNYKNILPLLQNMVEQIPINENSPTD